MKENPPQFARLDVILNFMLFLIFPWNLAMSKNVLTKAEFKSCERDLQDQKAKEQICIFS